MPDRSSIKKGAFLTGGHFPGEFIEARRKPLPRDLEEFESAATEADRLGAIENKHDAAIVEINRRLQAVRDQIDVVKTKVKRR